jgi:hypothetical protein
LPLLKRGEVFFKTNFYQWDHETSTKTITKIFYKNLIQCRNFYEVMANIEKKAYDDVLKLNLSSEVTTPK